MDKIDIDVLVDIAKSVEEGDPVDFGKLAVGKDQAFKMIAASVLEMFDKDNYTTEDKIILLSTITKLTVENMILNVKLLSLTDSNNEV
jgi:hypothetical protein